MARLNLKSILNFVIWHFNFNSKVFLKGLKYGNMCLRSSSLNLINVSRSLMPPNSDSILPFNDDSNPILQNVGV